MGKWLKRFILLIAAAAIVLIAGGLWLKSYVAPRESLDLRYEPVDIQAKALSMVKRLSPELVLTEADVNNLMKMNLSEIAEGLPAGVTLDGARFELEGDRLLAHLNITYRDRLPVGLLGTYKLSWQPPNVVLEPVSLTVRGHGLSTGLLERKIVPLEFSQNIISVGDVRFEADTVVVKMKLRLK
ncbi:hypothetical protein [Paenibacillus sp. NEAU-GSW1]|uniref:hypothetical protein n=1 Tax=Paenibacillus sp. NEAU-GSW1 TaxID=2682486 RepID=UPI0012E2D2E7|nr:hypothetical protein [Paenibacillus sp. NEAU-GSW1]MUT65985.1 hypothetical protein [Paenibacillus sp. NEAU-GSW1]